MCDFNLVSLSWSVVSDWNYTRPINREFYECSVECGWYHWVEFGTFYPVGNTLDLELTSENERIGETFEGSILPVCQCCHVLFFCYFSI